VSATATHGYVEVEGGRLYYERAGEGFPVVLIHPNLWDSRIWDPQFEEFARYHDVLRYDIRGYGRSDLPHQPYSDLRDLLYVIGELGIGRCALVGCALGAQLAIDLAIAQPEIVDAIVAVSPGITGYAWMDDGVQMLVEEVTRSLRAGNVEGAMNVQLAVWVPLKGDPASDEKIRSIAMENAHVLRLDDGLAEMPPSAVPHLGEIRAATMIVIGDRDLGEIHHIADELTDRIPGASKRVIAEADHLVNVRKPEKFNRLVLDFLSFRA
jgi:pimeloyl-ACP methyl ester carboxylesterase